MLNCVIVGCSAYWGGGGAAHGTLGNCLLSGNSISASASFSGGGGVYGAVLNNCTIWGNTALTQSGGGVINGSLYNCIVWGNTASSGANHDMYSTLIYCCTPGGSGSNISGDPLFVNAAGGNYRLQAGSPCIGAGNNSYVQGSTDLDGNPRTVNTTVDMGAYEYQSASTVLLVASAGAHGTVTPASTNAAIGSSPVFSVSAATYYRIQTLTTNGASVGWAFNNNSTATNYTWGNVKAAGTLAATFADRVTSDEGHVPYSWMAARGLLTDTNRTNGSCSDTDHDGLTAWQEYIAGTEPTNAASVLRIQNIISAGGSNIVRWSSSAAVRSKYNLLSCTNLAGGVWLPYTNNVLSTPPTNSLALPMLGRKKMFFKVTVTN